MGLYSKKRKLQIVMAGVLIFAGLMNGFSVSNAAGLQINRKSETSAVYAKGDVNFDGSVDITDALLIYQHSQEQRVLNTEEQKSADVNFDGQVSEEDAQVLLKKVTGEIDDFEEASGLTSASPSSSDNAQPTETPETPTQTPKQTPTQTPGESQATAILPGTPTPVAAQTPGTSTKPKINLLPGLYYQAYNIPASFNSLPADNTDSRMTFVAEGTKSNFDVNNNNPAGLGTNKYIEFTGQLTIEKSNTYTFYNASDDASCIYIDGELINNNDGCHGVQEVTSTKYLAEGTHDIKVTWYSIYGGDTLNVRYSSSDFSKKSIPDTLLNHVVAAPSGNTCTSFVFYASNNPSLTSNIICRIDQQTGSITTPLLPDGTGNAALIPTFITGASSVKVGGVEQTSGESAQNFANDVSYQFTDENDQTRTYTVSFNKRQTGLPAISIDTDGKQPITSKETYLSADIAITGGQTAYSVPLTRTTTNIRGRGNHSWTLAKKSYRLKFDQKISLLGFNQQKSYILQCNHVDPALIRNYVVYDFARKLGKTIGYTTNTAFFDLFLNGEYMGNYMLMEKLTTGKNQLDLMDASADEDVGCLLEVDFRNDQEGQLNVDYFKTNSGKMFAYKEPDVITNEQKAYIKSFVQDVETKIMNGQDTSEVMDMDSFVDWFLTMSVVKNNDADMWASCYFHKDKGGKLKWGPVWDFDTCLGDCSWVTSSDSWYPSGSNNWIDKLIKTDDFKVKFKKRWNEVRNTYISQIFTCIDSTYALIKPSWIENEAKWHVFDSFFWLTPNELKEVKTMDGQISYMKTWLTNRLAWMDANIEALTKVSNTASVGVSPLSENEIFTNCDNVRCGTISIPTRSNIFSQNDLSLNNNLQTRENRFIYEAYVAEGILKIAFISNVDLANGTKLFSSKTGSETEISMGLNLDLAVFDSRDSEGIKIVPATASTETSQAEPTPTPVVAPTSSDSGTATPTATAIALGTATPTATAIALGTATAAATATATAKAPLSSTKKVKQVILKQRRINNKKVKLFWKKTSGYSYQLTFSDKRAKGYRVLRRYNKKTSFVFVQPKKNQRYYIKIRVRLKMGGKYIFGKVSAPLTVRPSKKKQ